MPDPIETADSKAEALLLAQGWAWVGAAWRAADQPQARHSASQLQNVGWETKVLPPSPPRRAWRILYNERRGMWLEGRRVNI